MDTLVHIRLGIGSGLSNPAGLAQSLLNHLISITILNELFNHSFESWPNKISSNPTESP